MTARRQLLAAWQDLWTAADSINALRSLSLPLPKLPDGVTGLLYTLATKHDFRQFPGPGAVNPAVVSARSIWRGMYEQLCAGGDASAEPIDDGGVKAPAVKRVA